MVRLHVLATSLVSVWLFALPLAGSAEASEPDAPRSDAVVRPPELLELVPADYPATALAERREAVVTLRLTISRDGSVSEATVVEPTGHGFDEAATAAALRFRFAPARRGDAAVVSKILYRYAFELPPPEPSATNAAAVVRPEEKSAEVPVGPAAPAPVRAIPAGAPEASAGPSEVTVRGFSESDRLRRSAEAVTVIETERAKRQSTDMGELLARTQGVAVRRAGGLGSTTRFSLNGLTDEQVRFFLDGVPLELSGYPFGVANVPVNLVERIEIYSGVVPIRFGADALGGAVNLVSNPPVEGPHAAVSYETGSFDTHRVTFGAQHLDEPTGVFARMNGFFDSTRNDYPIGVEVPDERGRLSPATVYRFHDAYRASGANLDVGFVNRRWANRLLLRAFVTDFEKEFQHNQVMTVPYGEATYGEWSAGVSARYDAPLGHGARIETVLGYARTDGHFLDVTKCVYDWFGRCVRERRQPGETDARPHDQLFRDESGYARIHLGWRFTPEHAVRATSAPTYLTRTGDERRQTDPTARDALAAERELTTVVNGVEYELDLFDERLENIAFVKQYVQLLVSEEPRPGGLFRRRDRNTHRLGFGDALRYRFTPWLSAKASYESATRLPRPDEVFGDNAFIVANLELEPETSDNLNVGFAVDAKGTSSGDWRAGVNAFLRDAENLIVLLGSDRVQSYQNVFGARSLGTEAAVGFSALDELFVWDLNFTYLDFRNVSSDGTFGDFAGDRIPNRPWLFGNYSARFNLRGVATARDELSFGWNTRYVHDYFRGWESIGLREFKQTTPRQFVHDASVGYLVRGNGRLLSTSLEVQNLGDETVFDFYGVQRPGRAFYAKVTAEL
ncbi:MAG TPA: TonB-dependent siderophore myxochelin receptor MxcH [Polyangiaceae bacterium]